MQIFIYQRKYIDETDKKKHVTVGQRTRRGGLKCAVTCKLEYIK